MPDCFRQSFAIAALVAAVGCTSDGAPTAAQVALVELRLVRDSAAADAEVATFAGETLYLANNALITDEEILHVEPSVRSNQLILDVELTPAGDQELREATRENIGRRLAVLVDGQVRSAAVIRSEIDSQPSLHVGIPVSADEAEALAERFRSRWPG